MQKKAIVYLMHNSNEQLDLWRQYLPSENVELVTVSQDRDIVQILDNTSEESLPSLIIVETSIQSPNTKLLQSSNVTRWCKDNQSSIKVVFLTMRQESEITKVEQRWADRQGALCILPKIDLQNLQDQFKRIYGFLNLELPTINIVPKAPVVDVENITQSALGQAQLLIKKKDFTGAMNQLKTVIKHNRENLDAYLLCGEIYTELKNLEKAIQAYSQVISLNPQYFISYYKRGLAYINLKNYHAAIADFNQLINLEPSYAEAYNGRGLARKEIGDIEGSKWDYNQAIALKPNYAEAYLNRGMLLYILGDQVKARQDYDEAVRLDPQYEGSFFSWADNSAMKGLSIL